MLATFKINAKILDLCSSQRAILPGPDALKPNSLTSWVTVTGLRPGRVVGGAFSWFQKNGLAIFTISEKCCGIKEKRKGVADTRTSGR